MPTQHFRLAAISSDASAYGVEAVMSHPLADGTERPMGFASRSLNKRGICS